MISDNNFCLSQCEPYLAKISTTCAETLKSYNRALDEHNIATQELFKIRGRLEDKKLKLDVLERELVLEKDSRILPMMNSKRTHDPDPTYKEIIVGDGYLKGRFGCAGTESGGEKGGTRRRIGRAHV